MGLERASLLGALAIIGLAGVNAPAAQRRPSVRGTLHRTGIDPDASGQFDENVADGVPTGSGQVRGALRITASKLAARSTYAVKIGGVQVATLRTKRSGRGRLRLSATPGAYGQALTIDPRGRRLSLTDEGGEDVLAGEVADPTAPGAVRCCMSTADEQGCTELLPTECAAAGGIDMGAGGCDPDPCPSTGPDLCDGDPAENCDDGKQKSDGDGETLDDERPDGARRLRVR